MRAKVKSQAVCWVGRLDHNERQVKNRWKLLFSPVFNVCKFTALVVDGHDGWLFLQQCRWKLMAHGLIAFQVIDSICLGPGTGVEKIHSIFSYVAVHTNSKFETSLYVKFLICLWICICISKKMVIFSCVFRIGSFS